MFGLSVEIKERVMDWARSWVLNEVEFEGMPLEYAHLMEDRVYDNLMSDLKNFL